MQARSRSLEIFLFFLVFLYTKRLPKHTKSYLCGGELFSPNDWGGGGTHLSLPWEAQAAKLFASKEFSPKASLPIEVVYGGGERGSLEN